MKNKRIEEYKQPPFEVLEAWMLRSSGVLIGHKIYEQIQETIDKYPEYFEWEHKWKEIPQEVKDRHNEELEKANDRKWKRREKAKAERNKLSKEYKSGDIFTLEVFKEVINNLYYEEGIVRKEQKDWNTTKKKLWNKHFKEYKLEYRG